MNCVTLIALLVISAYGQSNTTTTNKPFTTLNPYCNCLSYTADNASWILDNNQGCRYCKGGCVNDVCECWSKEICDEIGDIVKGLAIGIIIAIVVGVGCFLCICGGIIYCIVAGVMCCAKA